VTPRPRGLDVGRIGELRPSRAVRTEALRDVPQSLQDARSKRITAKTVLNRIAKSSQIDQFRT